MELGKIINKNGEEYIISSENKNTIEHFEKTSSYTDIILKQINEDCLYDEFFEKINDSKITILDLGMNISLFSLGIMNKFREKNVKIFGVEPTPNHFAIAKELLKPFSKNVKIFNQAISYLDGNIDFYLCPENTTMNSINNHYSQKIVVEGIRLDTFLDRNKIKCVHFLKCDIEGSEMLVFTPEIISNVKDYIQTWFIEVHATDNGNSIDENREILKQMFANCGVSLVNFGYDALVTKG